MFNFNNQHVKKVFWPFKRLQESKHKLQNHHTLKLSGWQPWHSLMTVPFLHTGILNCIGPYPLVTVVSNILNGCYNVIIVFYFLLYSCTIEFIDIPWVWSEIDFMQLNIDVKLTHKLKNHGNTSSRKYQLNLVWGVAKALIKVACSYFTANWRWTKSHMQMRCKLLTAKWQHRSFVSIDSINHTQQLQSCT